MLNGQIDSIEIGMLAAIFSDNFLKELYEKSGNGYITVVEEISAWAHEFYNLYYLKLKNWDAFSESTDNIYQAVCWDDFVIAWGANRLNKYVSDTKR